jgi:pimeloyl-ACP methyl ester carboxylesterase
MRPVELGDVVLQMEPPEAGRYFAPILVVPGLFQSAECWRPFTSMLAHRGWEVYVLVRQPVEDDDEPSSASVDRDWARTLDAAALAAKRLGDKVIVFGADIGASVALSVASVTNPMALALFAPAEPAHVGSALARGLGFFERRRFNAGAGAAGTTVAPPANLAKELPHPKAAGAEPRALIDDLVAAKSFARPLLHPPAIVFAPERDPLVAADHSLGFAGTPQAKAAKARLAGRWWPMSGWQAACDEAHRFLILTLGDRVVEFPDEIIND